MKKLLALSLLLTFYFSNLQAQKQKKNPLPTPPNGIWIEELGFFVDQTEIANIHWLEFMMTSTDDLKERATLTPDSTVWTDLEPTDLYNEYYYNQYKSYFKESGYSFWPVVGISHEQAQQYCAWCSKVVTENFNQEKKRRKWRDYQVIFTFRLPTEAEWEAITSATNQTETPSFEGFAGINGNFLEEFEEGEPREVDLITKYVYYSTSSQRVTVGGICNLLGNVAEMVQEKGIAKGGSWYQLKEDSLPSKQQIYDKPTAWLGFRCICEVTFIPIEN